MKKSTQKDKRKKYKDKLQKRQKLMLNDNSKKNNEETVQQSDSIIDINYQKPNSFHNI